MKKVQVLVFLYNGKQYIEKIKSEFEKQIVHDCLLSLKFYLTQTDDGSEEELKRLHCSYKTIKKEEFSHSLTRQQAILESESDIAILLTQDVRITETNVYQVLIDSLNENVKFDYLRQVNSNRTLERYTRMINYPKESLVKTKESIPVLGLNTFFASDACSALDVSYFKSIGGYGEDLPTNEDMWYAYRVIMNGKAVRYCAESFVDHSHRFTLKQIRQRYFLFGQFFGMHKEFDSYSSTDAGLKLAFKVVGRALLEFNIPALVLFVPNMLARLKGKKKGFNSIRKKKENRK